jgi:hypothetical protein
MTSDVKLRGEGKEGNKVGKGDRYGEGEFVRGRVGRRKNFVCVCVFCC